MAFKVDITGDPAALISKLKLSKPVPVSSVLCVGFGVV